MSIGVKEMMMTSAHRIRWIVVLVLAEFGIASALLAGEPLEVIKVSTDRAIQILKDPQLQANEKKKERIERLKEIANPLFDFEEMAAVAGTALAPPHPQEQQEFVKLFRDYLKYPLNKVDLYAGEKGSLRAKSVEMITQVETTFVMPKERNSQSYIGCGALAGNGKFTTPWSKISASLTTTARNSTA
jgi:ABC-type transporter MlaC component